MQLGLSTEHPDPCSSTAFKLVSVIDSRALLCPIMRLGRKSTSAFRAFCFFGVPIEMPPVWSATAMFARSAYDTEVVAQARQATFSLKLDCRPFETQKAPLCSIPCEFWYKFSHISLSAGRNLIVPQACNMSIRHERAPPWRFGSCIVAESRIMNRHIFAWLTCTH